LVGHTHSRTHTHIDQTHSYTHRRNALNLLHLVVLLINFTSLLSKMSHDGEHRLTSSGMYEAPRYSKCKAMARRCYSVGVNMTTFYQPLPTPDYRVRIKHHENCSTMQPIYMQHVSGNGVVLGQTRPLLLLPFASDEQYTQRLRQACVEGGGYVDIPGIY
jgi:hypothetical protein